MPKIRARIEIKKAEEILAKNKELLKESEIVDFGTYAGPLDNTHYSKILLKTGALPVSEGFDFLLAQKIAQKYGVEVMARDFLEREDEPPMYKPVFGFTCLRIEDIEPGIGKLRQAQTELIEKIDKFVEYILNL